MTRRRREESSEEACGLESATPGVSGATSGLGLWGLGFSEVSSTPAWATDPGKHVELRTVVRKPGLSLLGASRAQNGKGNVQPHPPRPFHFFDAS